MAVISGTTGTATVANIKINATSWSCNKSVEVSAVPPTMGASPPVEGAEPGAVSISGTVTGKIDPAAAVCALTTLSGSVVLNVDAGMIYTIPAVYSKIQIDRKLAEATISVDFINSGTWTEANA